MILKLGQLIPIVLQVFDGRSDLNVWALIINDIGLVLKKVAMFHAENGLYLNNTEVMPLTTFITVQYQIEQEGYTLDSDTFYLEPILDVPEIILVGEVIKRNSIDMILGEVINVEKKV